MTDKDVKTNAQADDGRHEPSCREHLIARRQDLQCDLAGYVRLETRWSWLRLGAFGASVAAIVVLALMWGFLPAVIVAIPAVAVFRLTIVRHLHWKGHRSSTERILVVIDESLRDAVDDGKPVRDWRRPTDPDNAEAILPAAIDSGPIWPLTDQELDDLDLYAPPVGIFGLLNRTSTEAGARRLRDMLNGPCLSTEHIQCRQEAVRWLDSHDKQRVDVMASIIPLRGHSRRLDALVEPLRHAAPIHM